MDFAHLHLHTEYSLLDGCCVIKKVIDKALEIVSCNSLIFQYFCKSICRLDIGQTFFLQSAAQFLNVAVGDAAHIEAAPGGEEAA